MGQEWLTVQLALEHGFIEVAFLFSQLARKMLKLSDRMEDYSNHLGTMMVPPADNHDGILIRATTRLLSW
jgi:hypothetical protein